MLRTCSFVRRVDLLLKHLVNLLYHDASLQASFELSVIGILGHIFYIEVEAGPRVAHLHEHLTEVLD